MTNHEPKSNSIFPNTVLEEEVGTRSSCFQKRDQDPFFARSVTHNPNKHKSHIRVLLLANSRHCIFIAFFGHCLPFSCCSSVSIILYYSVCFHHVSSVSISSCSCCSIQQQQYYQLCITRFEWLSSSTHNVVGQVH